MITRIVKMTFREDAVDEFREIFQDVRLNIADFDGCQLLELLKDLEDKTIFFTYSLWESEEHLKAYLNSLLFRETWESTKALFAEEAEVWSLRNLG